ncbi:MAG: TetR family transcriptional regulator [Phycisphaeraceae bacterium]|nr:MAG: TetR family transcriptional regulator [Phycisphaeraceae bacterium]
MDTTMGTSKRDQLLEAALELFEAGGFHATGIDAIVARAGVAKMTLYKHFASKDELIVAALDRQSERAMACITKTIRERTPDPVERLLAVFDAGEEQCAKQGWRGCTFQRASGEFGEPENPVHIAASRHLARFREFLAELAADAGAKDPACLSHQLLVLYTGAIAVAQVSGDPEPVCAAKKTVRVLLGATCPPCD